MAMLSYIIGKKLSFIRVFYLIFDIMNRLNITTVDSTQFQGVSLSNNLLKAKIFRYFSVF